MASDRTYRRGLVQITRHDVDWENLDSDFDDLVNATSARLLALPLPISGHIYLNPAFTVEAPDDVPERIFLSQANRACIVWNKQLSRVIGSGARKRAARRASNFERMMVFSGALILHGKGAHAKRLNQAPCLQK